MILSETFLRMVRRATSDLDVDRLRSDVERFCQKHTDLTTRQKGFRMIAATARRAAAVGAAASLPPGWLAFAATAPELTALLVMQSRLILSLHLLYGGEPAPDERALEVLAGLASGAGIQVGRRLTTRAAEELATRLIVRLAGREATHVVPILGAVAAGTLNYWAVRGVGRAALARVERLYGPPEVHGKGPVLEVGGVIA
jgi:hypothetical protein